MNPHSAEFENEFVSFGHDDREAQAKKV